MKVFILLVNLHTKKHFYPPPSVMLVFDTSTKTCLMCVYINVMNTVCLIEIENPVILNRYKFCLCHDWS